MIITKAPITQEIIADGPATRAAAPDPNNHPEPINELRANMTPENKLIWCFFNVSTPY